MTFPDDLLEPVATLERTHLIILLVALVIALSWHPLWRTLRHIVTIVHEGGHAFMALLAGRELSGIRLHSDTSGLTVSRGKPRGFGMILTAASGYTAPAVVGLLGAWLVSLGYTMIWVWGFVLVLVAMLMKIRNWFGAWVLLATGAVIGAATWFGPPEIHVWIGTLLASLLTIGSVRAVIELGRSRARGARSTDADMLGHITWLPAPLWVAGFFLITVGCTVAGVWLLLG
ncbi:M50 family metallopeptidase [Jonesia quinghaiensis]|uniref:M50 family metallopeptidase n=1 Tax=Jonesia quinghaiensis TaxID=262806 RepID=UPI0004096B0B|nr:M50 family metallopeptidase [Jonesia quinghaiensis]